MSKRTMIVVILALVCGGSAAVGVDQLRQRAASAAQVETLSVVVASMDVPRGGVLTKDVLKLKTWPKSMVPPGVLTSLETALDRAVIVPLVRGEPVLDAKLADKDAGRGLAAMIPRGMRAFTIRTPHVAAGVGGFILPGNRVDVLLTTTAGGHNDPTGGAATTTLLQNVQILAVDRMLDSTDGQGMDPKKLNSVTLLVTPDQTAKLDLGMNKGILHLSLRNPEDEEDARTQPATMRQLQFHQEPAQSQASRAGSVVSDLFKAVASAVAAKQAMAAQQKENETPTVVAAPVEAAPRHVQIRTVRGLHRGTIIVERRP